MDNKIIIGGMVLAAGIGLIVYLSKKNKRVTVSNNNILETDYKPSNKLSLLGNNTVSISEEISGKKVIVTLSVSGGITSNDLISFTSPLKSPAAYKVKRYTNGAETGEFYIDGDFAYVSGFGDGVITWSYDL